MKKLIIILIAMFLAACASKKTMLQGNELVLLDISESMEENPSFLNLKIGESTSSDVLLVMDDSQYLQEDAKPNPIIGEKGIGFEYYYLIDHRYSRIFRFYFENDILKRITIDSSFLELGNVITRFGEPDFIYSTQWMTPKGQDVSVTLLYQDIGLLISASPSLQKKDLVVCEDSKVGVINLFTLDDIQSWYEYDLSLLTSGLENPSAHLYEWKGFGKLSDLYPNVIPAE